MNRDLSEYLHRNQNNFEIDGVKFYAEEIPEEVYLNLEIDICTGCYFGHGNECHYPHPDDITLCCSDDRKDGINVVFKKVEG